MLKTLTSFACRLFDCNSGSKKTQEEKPTLKEAVDRYEQSTANELDMAEAMMRDLGEQARRRAVG